MESPWIGARGTLPIFTQGVGTKVQPSTASGAGTSVSVETCRDATVSAQIVVRGSHGPVTGVTAAVATDLKNGPDHLLKKENIALFRQSFIDFTTVEANTGNTPVPANSPTRDGRIPDPLIPLMDPYTGSSVGQPFNVSAGESLPIFLDVHVPKGTAAGTYRSTVHVSADGGLFADVPLSVTVWDLDLPDMRSVATHFKMSVNSLHLYHAGLSRCSSGNCYLDWNNQSRKVVKRYEEMAHAHRVDTQQNFLTFPGDRCSVPTDWTAFDSAMSPYMDGTYFSDGVPSGRVDTPFSPGVDYGLDGTCSQAQYTAIARAWATHLKAKGWFDKAIVYAFDEPPVSAFKKIALNSSWLQAADPDWKSRVLDTVTPDPTNVAILSPALGTYVVALPWYDNWWDHGPLYGRKEWPKLFAQGIQLWFYEGNSVLPPYPTFATNTLDGLEPVMMMWGSWYEGATGFLYWDVSAWEEANPWGPETHWGKTGDGVLLYPGNHGGIRAPVGSPADVAIDGPIASYRLKMVRTGLQDWALFELAASKGFKTLVREQIATVYGQFGACTYSGCPKPAAGFFWKTDEPAMAAIRRTIVQALLKKS